MKLTDITNSLVGKKDYVAQLNDLLDTSTNLDLSSNKENSFSSVLKQSIEEVNNEQVEAYTAMEEIATGKVDNLQEAVQKIQEAELSLKLGLEVKNKALGAYKQVMSMQI
jgi:flagellar hook-basal body complex protein FliE